MDEEVKQKFIDAGKAVQEAKDVAENVAKPGEKYLDIAEAIEKSIRDQGLEPAFPVNLSRNEEAAHYTPGPNNSRILKEDDVLKIDIGAQKDGYIADTAITVNPSGEHKEMIQAAKDVLEKALEFIEPGKTVGELGTFIEKQVPDQYNVVQNLTGHYVGRYKQHAGVSVPNVHNQNTHTFEEGDSVAIEPFITTGSGRVRNGKDGNIYKIEQERNVRGRTERQLMKEVNGFNGLPFTSRWLKDFGGRKSMALKKLVQQNIVHSYPILRDNDDSIVVQAEQTVLVGVDNGENIITTRR